MTKSANAVFTPSINNIAFSNATVQSLDALVSRRKNWEAIDYKKANEGLYSLLADCLDIFNSKFVQASESDKKTLRLDLTARLKADGVKVQKNSTTLTMFVRVVFGSDRKRAQGYAYVLKAAISHEVSAANLPQYIANEGGIEEIKRKMIVSEAALARQAERAAAKTEVLANIEQAAVTPIAQLPLAGVTGQYALLLAKPTPNGMVSVVGVLDDVEEALYNAFLIKMAERKAISNAEAKALSKETSDLLGQSLNSANDTQAQLAA